MRHDRVTGVNICAHPIPSVWGKKLTADFNGGNQSSDGGLVLLREAEGKLGLLPVGHGLDSRIPEAAAFRIMPRSKALRFASVPKAAAVNAMARGSQHKRHQRYEPVDRPRGGEVR